MKAYIGTKTLAAEPMTFGDFCLTVKKIPYAPVEGAREGYHVQYPDGYESWSPKDVFEESYREILPDDRLIDYSVFPSVRKTISVKEDADYGGAHYYQIQNSLGFNNGEAQYDPTIQHIQFVQKNLDGTMIPGVQSEQLAYILLDRCLKLGAKFPSPQTKMMVEGLEKFLAACEERIADRMGRGVMGDLKK